MSSGFTFKRFTVNHALCAMKVGTDGVLLGAWAEGGRRVLDIGTGSGLIALMMAQRYPTAHVTAIDIEPDACLQARENALRSPFAERISVEETALQDFAADEQFDAIVCNPPFYAATPASKTAQRTMARCAATLPFADLFKHAARLLGADGVMSVVIPAACRSKFDAEAAFAGLFPRRACGIRTLARKPVSRWLLEYGKRPATDIIEEEHCLNNDDMSHSCWYADLTKDFYL